MAEISPLDVSIFDKEMADSAFVALQKKLEGNPGATSLLTSLKRSHEALLAKTEETVPSQVEPAPEESVATAQAIVEELRKSTEGLQDTNPILNLSLRVLEPTLAFMGTLREGVKDRGQWLIDAKEFRDKYGVPIEATSEPGVALAMADWGTKKAAGLPPSPKDPHPSINTIFNNAYFDIYRSSLEKGFLLGAKVSAHMLIDDPRKEKLEKIVKEGEEEEKRLGLKPIEPLAEVPPKETAPPEPQTKRKRFGFF